MKDEDKKVLDEMILRKQLSLEMFCHATLKRDVVMDVWDGHHPVEEHTTSTLSPTGTRVLITMWSRFGHVGIRAREIDRIEHGYDVCVDPDWLEDWQPKWEPSEAVRGILARLTS